MEHERPSMSVKCFDKVVKPVKVVKIKPVKVLGPKPEKARRITRDDPAYEAPNGPVAEIRGSTTVRRVAPTMVAGTVNARLLDLAKYGY